jgi:hypothetical protein
MEQQCARLDQDSWVAHPASIQIKIIIIAIVIVHDHHLHSQTASAPLPAGNKKSPRPTCGRGPKPHRGATTVRSPAVCK